jgi:hypothetical protein
MHVEFTDDEVNEALILRGFDTLTVANADHEELEASLAFSTLFKAWRAQGLSPREIRNKCRKRGWPIPVGYRGDEFLTD